MHPDFPLPDLDDALTRGFWQAADRGELAVPWCRDCCRWVWFPEERCPQCKSGLDWRATSGRGRLFSWTVVHRVLLAEYEGLVPYTSALVALEEAPHVRIVTRMVDVDAADLVADMHVEVSFRRLRFRGATRDVLAPLFRPSRLGHMTTWFGTG